MLNLPGFADSPRSAIERRIDSLRDEIVSLRKEASRLGNSAYDAGRSGVSEIEDFMEQAWPLVRARARNVERVARDNPTATAAAIGLVTLGLIAAIVYSRR